jgi:hypothetical protein
MSKRSIAVLVALALAGFAVAFYVTDRKQGVSPRSTAAAQPQSSTGSRGHLAKIVATSPLPPMRSGYSESEHDVLWQQFKPNTSQADGPLTAEGLRQLATTTKASTPAKNMWPVIEDVIYGNSSALESRLDTGRLRGDATFYLGYPYDVYESLLDLAIEAGQRDVIKLLLNHSASVNPSALYSSNGGAVSVKSPLTIAARDGEDDVVQLLLSGGANVNQPSGSPNGDTALKAAVYAQNVPTVYLLLTHGADIDSVLGPNKKVPQFLVQADQRAPRMIALRNLLVNYGAEMPTG